MTADDEVQRWAQENRHDGHEAFADFIRPYGEYTAYVPVGVGLFGAGLLAQSRGLECAGARVSASIAVSAVFEGLAKFIAGRNRPSAGLGSDAFEPFSTNSSFPSGHATVAFALSTSLADDIDRPWATVGLYTLAIAASWARVIDNLHWLSDTAAGAIVGYYSAKLTRAWLLPPDREVGPQVTITPGGPALAWAVGF